ncbi:glycoside hydrolase family 28 protein [Ginsengibacter hankyongi]|nr:glycosyl hydrolase family 28 protein [Ginsengibacter hankyongi]
MQNIYPGKSIQLLAVCILFFTATQAQLSISSKISVYNIIDYGAVGDGKISNTAAIQKAINDCHKHGGGTIVIPAGSFITGTVRLFSNMNLYLEAGAILTGSTQNNDYLYQKDFGFSGPGAGIKTGILVAHHEQNISISGQGIVTGNGTSFMYMDSLQYGMDFAPKYTRQKDNYMNPKYGRDDGPVLWKGTYEERPGVMFIFSDCKNITIRDIRLEESPNWTIAFLNSEDIKINGISILNNMNIPNSDGIDMYDSKNITISNCNIQAGDDAIAVVSSSNITASNCILHSRSSGIRIGYNVFNHNNSGNLLFNNISIYDSNRGIGIYQRQKGDMENMVFSNITISTRLHSGQWWGHGEPIHISSVPGLGSKETGCIRHVRFSNIIASSESGILVYAASGGLIDDISFDNITLSIKQSSLAEGYGGNFDLRPTNDIALGIFEHSIPAIYSENADNVFMKDVHINWAKGLPSYFTHSVECRNFESVIIDGLHENIGGKGRNKVSTLYLHKGKTSIVKGITSTDKNKRLVIKDDKG